MFIKKEIVFVYFFQKSTRLKHHHVRIEVDDYEKKKKKELKAYGNRAYY